MEGLRTRPVAPRTRPGGEGPGYNVLMAEDQGTKTADAVPEPDSGLKRLLTYTFITLVLAVLAAFGAVSLVIRWFDK